MADSKNSKKCFVKVGKVWKRGDLVGEKIKDISPSVYSYKYYLISFPGGEYREAPEQDVYMEIE